MERKTIKNYIILLLFICTSSMKGQKSTASINLIEVGTMSLNTEFGVRVGSRQTLHIPIAWNPWTFQGNKKFKHLSISPQWRYWKTEEYLGHFFGANLIGSRYNVGLTDYRFDGWAYGLGGSWGYAWILGKRWNIEVQAGVGLVRSDYKRFDCGRCGDFLSKESKWFVTPNRLAVSFVYMF